MAISTIHHVFPDFPPPIPRTTAPTPLPSFKIINKSVTIPEHTVTTHMPMQEGGVYHTIAWIIIIIIIIFITIILIEALTPRKIIIRQASGEQHQPAMKPPTPYNYKGIKIKIRELFLRLRSKLEATLGTNLHSKTVQEISKITGKYKLFAKRYTEIMYGPREPDIETVKELEGLVNDEK